MDYKLDIDYKSEITSHNDEPDAQKEESAENSNVEYTKIESPCQGMFAQKMMHHQEQDWIQHVHAE